MDLRALLRARCFVAGYGPDQQSVVSAQWSVLIGLWERGLFLVAGYD